MKLINGHDIMDRWIDIIQRWQLQCKDNQVVVNQFLTKNTANTLKKNGVGGAD